jgi:hypothetical protein
MRSGGTVLKPNRKWTSSERRGAPSAAQQRYLDKQAEELRKQKHDPQTDNQKGDANG